MIARTINVLDISAKVIGAGAVIIAFLSVLLPPVEKGVAAFMAWRFGATGFVYYEIGHDNKLTDDGQIRQLKSNGILFEQISIGDKLQPDHLSRVYFHDEAGENERVRFILEYPSCVIVLGKEKPFPVEKAKSGGWLFVGTSACGLFN